MAETRYSDNDLQEFQALIEEKLAVARENYDELQRALSHSDHNTTDDTTITSPVEGTTTTDPLLLTTSSSSSSSSSSSVVVPRR